jgi:putative endonuclease
MNSSEYKITEQLKASNGVRPNVLQKITSIRANGDNWVYTYVLMSEKDGNFYTGTTNDLLKRLEQHKNGLVVSTKYRLPIKLIYFEACLNKDDAFRRERYLKTGMGKRYLKNRLSSSLNNFRKEEKHV